jgi:hypothetical protein
LIEAASFTIEVVVPDGPSRWEASETTMSMIRAIADRGGIDAGGVNRVVFRYHGSDFSYGGSLDPMKGDVEWGWALSGTAEPSVRTAVSQVKTTSQIVGPSIGMGHGSTAAPLGFTSGWYSDFWGRRHTLFSAATALYHFANVKAYY